MTVSRWCADLTAETWRLYEFGEGREIEVKGHDLCLFERVAGKARGHGESCQTPRCREAADCTCPCHAAPTSEEQR